MTTLEYTHSFESDSSVVDGVYYNEHDRTLSVELDNNVYRYSGVPKSVFEAFKGASSHGRYFATSIKSNYGPGEYVGHWDYIFDNVVGVVPAPDMGAVGTPKGLTLASDAKITDSTVDSGVRINLGPVQTVPVGVQFKHAVVFTVEGGNTRKTYNVEAGSVNEAVEALEEVAGALGVGVNVKEVTVYFE